VGAAEFNSTLKVACMFSGQPLRDNCHMSIRAHECWCVQCPQNAHQVFRQRQGHAGGGVCKRSGRLPKGWQGKGVPWHRPPACPPSCPSCPALPCPSCLVHCCGKGVAGRPKRGRQARGEVACGNALCPTSSRVPLVEGVDACLSLHSGRSFLYCMF